MDLVKQAYDNVLWLSNDGYKDTYLVPMAKELSSKTLSLLVHYNKRANTKLSLVDLIYNTIGEDKTYIDLYRIVVESDMPYKGMVETFGKGEFEFIAHFTTLTDALEVVYNYVRRLFTNIIIKKGIDDMGTRHGPAAINNTNLEVNVDKAIFSTRSIYSFGTWNIKTYGDACRLGSRRLKNILEEDDYMLISQKLMLMDYEKYETFIEK